MYRLFRAAVQSASMKVLKDEGFSSCAWRKGADHSVTCQKTCLRFIPDVFSESKFVCVQTYLIQSHALVSVLLSQLLTLVNTALGEKQTNNKKNEINNIVFLCLFHYFRVLLNAAIWRGIIRYTVQIPHFRSWYQRKEGARYPTHCV